MVVRKVSWLTWRRSSLIVAVVTGVLLLVASSAMAANFRLWDERPVLRVREPMVVTVTSPEGGDDHRTQLTGDGRFDDD